MSSLSLCRREDERRKAETSPFVNRASLKPTLHDQLLGADITFSIATDRTPHSGMTVIESGSKP